MIINAFILSAEDFLDWCEIEYGLEVEGVFYWADNKNWVRFRVKSDGTCYQVATGMVSRTMPMQWHDNNLRDARYMLINALDALQQKRDPTHEVYKARKERLAREGVNNAWAEIVKEDALFQHVQQITEAENNRFRQLIERMFDDD